MKRFYVMLLALVMTLNLAAAVGAEDVTAVTDVEEIATQYMVGDPEEALVIEIPDITCRAGETITVPIEITYNPGFMALCLDLDIPDWLTLDSVSYRNSNFGTPSIAGNSYVWFFASGDNNKTGMLMEMTFAIADEVEEGIYSDCIKFTLGEGGLFNYDEDVVTLEVDNGTVAIIHCGHVETEVRDAITETCSDDGYTGDIYCLDCGEKVEDGDVIPATGDHIDADGEWEKDDVYHWHTCGCGVKLDMAIHSGGEATCIAKAVCEFCGTDYGEVDKANHVGGTETDKDATHHWGICECGDPIAKEEHIGGTADCVTKAICEVCGTPYGDIDETNHSAVIHKEKVHVTCTSAGAIEHWYCNGCGRYFTDEACTTEISEADTVVVYNSNVWLHNPQIGRIYSVITTDDGSMAIRWGGSFETETRDAKPCTPDEDGYTGDTYCADCGILLEYGEAIPAVPAGEHKLNEEATLFGSDYWGNGDPEEDRGSSFDKAFDGDPLTYYDAYDTTPDAEVGIRLDSPAKLTGVRILPRIHGDAVPYITPLRGTHGFNSHENYENLFDSDPDTKWCVVGQDSVSVTWKMPEPAAIDGYTMMTGNDTDEYPHRNPRTWTLWGSLDNIHWYLIDEQTDNTEVPAGNFEEYTVLLDERADFYQYFELEITEYSGDISEFQLSEFTLLYDGWDEEYDWGVDGFMDRMKGLTVQGSVNGEEWITLYQFPDKEYGPHWYELTEDMLASAAQDYAFTQFRLINKWEHLNMGEIEFYGTYDHELESFPTVIEEPIYSYLTAEQFVPMFHDYDCWYFCEPGEDGMTRFEREFEGKEPVALIGGVGFDETVLDIRTVDGKPVFAVAPWAFVYEDGIIEVVVDENSNCMGIMDNAFRDCENLEKVTVSNSLKWVWNGAFLATPSLKEIVKIDENLTDEEKEERGHRFVEVIDDALISEGQYLCVYPSAKEYVETYTIPEGVTVLEQYSFWNSKIGEITMGANVQVIGHGAFIGSEAHTIELSPALTEIHSYAFGECKNLINLVIPSDDVEIDCYMDEDPDLTDDDFMFDPWLFKNTNHDERTEPLVVTSYEGSMIEEYIDYIHSLEIEDYDMSHVVFNPCEDITWFYGDWFDECGENEVFLIGLNAPADAQIGELPQYTEDGRTIIGVRYDGNWNGISDSKAIGDENGRLVIPEGYKYICEGPLGGCENLRTLVIPASLEDSYGRAFAYMYNLEKFEVADGAENYWTSEDGMCLYHKNPNGRVIFDTFALANEVTHVDVAEGTHEINSAAFHESKTIRTVTLPESLAEIGNHAFQDSTLESIEIPAGVSMIGDLTFANCPNLKEVKIERLAGNFCDNEHHDFTTVFDGSDNVTVYVYGGTDAHRAAEEYGWNYEVVELEETYYDMYTANDGVHLRGVVPATVNGDPVTEFVIPDEVMVIDEEAFMDVEITSVTFPKTLYYIGSRAFDGCGEFEIAYSGAVSLRWEEDSFDNTINFEERYYGMLTVNQYWDGKFLYYLFPDSKEAVVRSWWYSALDQNGEMEIPQSFYCGYDDQIYTITVIEPNALRPEQPEGLDHYFNTDAAGWGWELEYADWVHTYPKSIVLPDTVRYIGDEAFAGHTYENDTYGLESVRFPQSVQYIGDCIFGYNKTVKTFTGLDAYTDEESTNPYRIADGCVVNVWNEHILTNYPMGSEAESYTTPDGIEVIGYKAFEWSDNLVHVTVSEGVRRLEHGSFDTQHLVSVDLPSTLTEIGHGAFRYAWELAEVTFPNGNDRYHVGEDGIVREDETTFALYPYALIPEDGVVVIPEDITGIKDGAMQGAKQMTELVIPNSVEWIGNFAFSDAYNLRKVTIEGTIKEDMLIHVFSSCRNLEEIVYHGDSIGLFVFFRDRDWEIAYDYDEDGNRVPKKFDFRLINKDTDISFYILDDWDDRDYDTYTPEDNPYFNLIRGSEGPTLLGDIDGDGEVTPGDRMILARTVAGWEGYPMEALDPAAADIDGDGELTPNDRMILARHVAAWEGYESLDSFRE